MAALIHPMTMKLKICIFFCCWETRHSAFQLVDNHGNVIKDAFSRVLSFSCFREGETKAGDDCHLFSSLIHVDSGEGEDSGLK